MIAAFVAAAEAALEELSAIANVLPAPPLPFVPREHHGRRVVMATLVYAGEAASEEPEQIVRVERGTEALLLHTLLGGAVLLQEGAHD